MGWLFLQRFVCTTIQISRGTPASQGKYKVSGARLESIFGQRIYRALLTASAPTNLGDRRDPGYSIAYSD